MNIYRYSEWDGSQDMFDSDADELMNELGRQLMSDGDLSDALRQMQRSGMRDSQGRRLPSIQELLQRLRQRKQSQLDKYDLGSMLDELRQKLDDIMKTERQGIQKKLDEAKQKAQEGAGAVSPEMQQRLLKTLEDRAAQNLEKLGKLPPDIGGQIKELTQYDFMDEDARRQFQELVDMLKKHAMESYGRDMIQKLTGMDAGSLAGIRHMVEALNQMLEQRLRGEEPDFDQFMEQFGDYFGPNPPRNLDELMERVQNQIAQAQSLLDSLSPADRKELENLLRSMLDEATQYELAKLAANLEALHPSDRLRQQYPFSGEESISYTEALKLMETLQKMDKLEEQLKDSQYNRSLDDVNEKLVRELLGDEAAAELERLRNITKVLEEAGYIRWKDGKYELTPRGMRKIGQRALEDIFAQLRKDRIGGHNLNLRGSGGERIDETKQYEFSDDFRVHLQKTIMNSIYRQPSKPPVKLSIEDFEVFKTEAVTRSATVLMLDLSLSMPMRGNFEAAKRVTVALDGLIRSQYPKDSLYIIGFSSYARQIKKEDLSYMRWDDFDPYTNMQHGFYLARKLLSREQCSNKQIIMISDGEPTAHFEGENVFFQYPPTLRTLQVTLREVRYCTQKGIIINTFMLESGRSLSGFVSQMAHLNKGRVFYTRADRLGEYLLMDYVANKKKRI
ncbi:MAG: VWA domain-containing protein [Chloroflexi bacterium]|nr:VWA domain-containing protein [Chloroflexota bacterium]